jgi:hypothetical protein
VRSAHFPSHFKALTSVPKYDSETNPSVWLEDYRLACNVSGARDLFIIKNLSLHLADSARTWLDHLPRGKIDNWLQLRDAFISNFQGTYARPENPVDLCNCKQMKGESMRDYIRRFSKRCTELPNTIDMDVISAFQNGTTCVGDSPRGPLNNQGKPTSPHKNVKHKLIHEPTTHTQHDHDPGGPRGPPKWLD